MTIRKVNLDRLTEADTTLAPAYAGRASTAPVPKFKLPAHEMTPANAYQLIHDELMLDGNARLNLATFVTTWMEPEAEKLMAETFDKNMIDKDEYPQTAAIEERCINMVARLFNSPEHEQAVGASAIGSSEAVMLAGMAMKWRWRARRRAAGKPTEPHHGFQRAGGVGKVLPLLGYRTPLHSHRTRSLRDPSRRRERAYRRKYHRCSSYSGDHVYR